MDLKYLLLLQQLREATDNFLSPFMMAVSDFIISWIPIAIVVFIYLCVNKRWGYYLMANFFVGGIVNQTLKNTFCVYRPWIRDAAIVPYGNAKLTATGYSFPSGHTQMGTSFFGSLAVIFRRSKWAIALCVIAILLVGFSRNYLGVHTPQDVAVGLLVALLVLGFNTWLFGWLSVHRNGDILVLVLGLLALGGYVAYIQLKSYPEDYVDGVLLVDPQRMKGDCFYYLGVVGGFLTGWFVERRWIRFEVEKPWWQRILRFAIAIGFIVLIMKLLSPILFAELGHDWGLVLTEIILMWTILILMPLLCKVGL